MGISPSWALQLLGGCPGYRIDQGKVFWADRVLDGADAPTFQTFGIGRRACYHDYARDHYRVYFGSQPISGAHPASFTLLQSGYARDRAAVYAAGQLISTRPATFRSLGEGDYATDGVDYFWGKRRFDARSFQLLRWGYARDAFGVYAAGKAMPGRDPATYVQLDAVYAVDRNSVYAGAYTIKGAHPSTFHRIGRGYARDRRTVYFYSVELAGADAENFRVISECNATPFATDGTSVYQGDRRLPLVDVRSFRCLGGAYARDATGIYRDGKRLESADAASFYVVRGFGFDKDFGYSVSGLSLERFCKRRDDVPGDLDCCHIESSCRK
jgi:hypothetical protein